MPNLRVIYDNVADVASTLTASSTSGSLAASNLLIDTKAQVHRSVGKSVTYSLTWASAKVVGAVALPATNLSSTATIRVRLYSDTAMATLLADSGELLACPSSQLGLFGWSGTPDANSFSFGGASKSAVWFNPQVSGVRACSVTLDDQDNQAGYIDCSRLVIGPYWEADKNPQYGGSSNVVDMSKSDRADSGDFLVSRGAMYETMSLTLDGLTEARRAELRKIIRSSGTFRNLFISLLPNEANLPTPVVIDGLVMEIDGKPLTVLPDNAGEQDHMIYGHRNSGAFTFDHFNSFSLPLEIEGW